MKEQKINPGNKIIIGCIIILFAAAVVFVTIKANNRNKVLKNISNKYDEFAKCLTDRGAVMYSMASCGHCLAQKNIFNKSFEYIKYVECSENPQLCVDNNINAVPAWLIGTSTKLEGFDENKTMKELSDATGCLLP